MATTERMFLNARLFALETTNRRILEAEAAQERSERRARIEAMAKAHGTTPQKMFTSFIPAAKG
jgi:hypothetical protein